MARYSKRDAMFFSCSATLAELIDLAVAKYDGAAAEITESITALV
jgi:hypothetical protein